MKKFLLFFMLTLFAFGVNAQVLPTNWTGDTGIDVYQETTDVHSGSSSVKVNVNTGSQSSCDFVSDVEIAVTAGNTFSLSFYAKTSAHERVRVVYHWVGASTTYSSSYAGDGVEDADYVQFTETGTVPSGATGLNIGLRFYDQSGFSAPETQYIDDVTFESPTGTSLPVSNGDFESWPAGNDQTSTVAAPATQLSAGTISSIATDSVPVMRFDITDAGSGDGLPTVVTGVYFVAGPNNTIDLQQNLGGGGIYDLTNSAVVPFTGQPTITANSAYLPVNITIPDGQTVSFEAYAKIDNNNAPDGGILQFQINAANHGFTAAASGSDFESTFAGGDIVGNNFTVEVVATQYTFLQQPTNVDVNAIMTPAVQVGATDAGGNVDVDYSTFIQLNFSGTGLMSGVNGAVPTDGTLTFSDISFDTPQTGVHLYASGGSLPNQNSTNFDINVIGGGTSCANAVSIDVGTHTAAHTATDDYDQWYVYHATADGRITVSNCSSGYSGDTYVEIIEGSCGGSNFDLADDVCGTLESLSFNVTAGNDYYIGWGDWDTATPGTYDWTLSFTAPVNIINAYAVSNDSLVLHYESGLTSVNPADYNLTATGQTTINFTAATIDATYDSIVYLKAQNNFAVNVLRDNINDVANNTTFQFYAGVLPISYTNTANDPDTVRQGYNVTLSGVVTANDNYNQVWIQDSNNPMSGVMIYSSSFTSTVAVGDQITVVGQKALYNGATEITDPMLISTTSGGTPTPAVINTADLEYNKTQDDPAAEPWEGQLVTVQGIVIDSLNASHYEYFGHDCSGNIICFDDDVIYHYGGGFALTTGTMYNITGVVTYSYGHYKVNPRGTDDAVEITRDLTSVVEDPASQVADATIDGTLAVDSLHAIEAFKFKITDEGTDGLPTKLSQFDIYAGPNNTVDLAGDAIASGWFDFGDAANPIVFSAEPDFNTDHFTFYVDPATAVIDNGTSKEVILHLWFDPAYLVDESVLQLMIKSGMSGFVADCISSQFTSSFAADITGGALTIDTNVGIDAINGKNIKVYPNPSNGIININVKNNYELEVSDITGRIISTKSLTGNTSIQINTTGVYFLKFSDENGTYVQKVIVQ